MLFGDAVVGSDDVGLVVVACVVVDVGDGVAVIVAVYVHEVYGVDIHVAGVVVGSISVRDVVDIYMWHW